MQAYLVHVRIEVLVGSSLSCCRPVAAVESPEGDSDAIESLEEARHY